MTAQHNLNASLDMPDSGARRPDRQSYAQARSESIDLAPMNPIQTDLMPMNPQQTDLTEQLKQAASKDKGKKKGFLKKDKKSKPTKPEITTSGGNTPRSLNTSRGSAGNPKVTLSDWDKSQVVHVNIQRPVPESRMAAFKKGARDMLQPPPRAPPGKARPGDTLAPLKPPPPLELCRMGNVLYLLLLLGILFGIIFTAMQSVWIGFFYIGPAFLGLSCFGLIGKCFLTKLYEDDPIPIASQLVKDYNAYFSPPVPQEGRVGGTWQTPRMALSSSYTATAPLQRTHEMIPMQTMSGHHSGSMSFSDTKPITSGNRSLEHSRESLPTFQNYGYRNDNSPHQDTRSQPRHDRPSQNSGSKYI